MKYIIILFLWICLSCASQTSPDSQTSAHKDAEAQEVNPEEKEKASSTQSSKDSSSSQKTFVVPFQSDQWHSLEYSSIPSHEVTFASDHIQIKVRSSASPLIYPMKDNPLLVKQVSIKGVVSQLLNISPAEKQGEKGLDDFNLRVGLVLLGAKRLEWYQKLTAADWIKQMFALAPKDQGIDHVYFLNGVLSPSLVNKKRTHPLSKYIKEHYVWLMNQSGVFDYTYTLEQPRKTVALWISVDGDDTGSNFDLKINNITLFK